MLRNRIIAKDKQMTQLWEHIESMSNCKSYPFNGNLEIEVSVNNILEDCTTLPRAQEKIKEMDNTIRQYHSYIQNLEKVNFFVINKSF